MTIALVWYMRVDLQRNEGNTPPPQLSSTSADRFGKTEEMSRARRERPVRWRLLRSTEPRLEKAHRQHSIRPELWPVAVHLRIPAFEPGASCIVHSKPPLGSVDQRR